MRYADDCWCCDGKIESAASAVGQAGEKLQYIPCARDAESGYLLAHPACFAERHGVDALVNVVHEHDWQTSNGGLPLDTKVPAQSICRRSALGELCWVWRMRSYDS